MVVPSSMPDDGLSVARLFRYGETVFRNSPIYEYAPTGSITRSFGEVAEMSRRLASALDSLGVKRQGVVATFCWNSFAHLAAYFAVPSSGRVLHTLNLRLHVDQLAYIMNQAEDELVLVDADLCELLAEVLPRVPSVRHVVVNGAHSVGFSGVRVHDFDELLRSHQAVRHFPSVDETETAALCFTTGTTGAPKGLAYNHRSIFTHALMVSTGNIFSFSTSDVVMPMVPMFHANAWGWIHAAWMAGSSIVLCSRYLQPEHIASMVREHRPTCAAAVPTIWSSVVQWADDKAIDFSSFRLAVVGGAALHGSLVRHADEHGLTLSQGWGMTETSPLVTFSAAPDGVPLDEKVRHVTRAGRLLPGIDLRLVDETGEVLPWDGASVGEVQLEGPTIARRYAPVDWVERFNEGWLRTGDLASVTETGIVELKDRVKDGIKSGGEWISSIQLEDVIASHPAVTEVAVIGVPDPRWDERPLAVVRFRPDSTASWEEIAKWLHGRVAKWWIPERWAVIGDFPRTSVGKCDKSALRGMVADRVLRSERVD